MMARWRDKVQDRVQHDIGEWLYNTHDSVDVLPTQGLFNGQCARNAIEWSRKRASCVVVMGIYVEDGRTVLHYWNKHESGKYLETTLGYRAEGNIVYYPLRTIPASDYKIIGMVFDDAVDYFTQRFTSRLDRRVLGETRVI